MNVDDDDDGERRKEFSVYVFWENGVSVER